MKVLCPKCKYEWESRVDQPKACPACKVRLDYGPYKIGIKPEVKEK